MHMKQQCIGRTAILSLNVDGNQNEKSCVAIVKTYFNI
jgi:hypothetical protein